MKPSVQLTPKMVRDAQQDEAPWRVGNQVLYDLCRCHPRHVDDAAIIAKVWLIGRAYSAALERGRGMTVGDEVSNEQFYTEHIAKALRKSDLDRKLKALDSAQDINESNVGQVLDVHGYLVDLFETLTRKEKRSLASKYLHFHKPNLFFLYDSRANEGIRVCGVSAKAVDVPDGADARYARFVGKALALREYVASTFKTKLTLRQLDRLLLNLHRDRRG
jgi:hypothetical protein